MTHTSIIFHIMLHAVSVVIAVFLSMIAVIAYRRTGSAKVLVMSSGFVALSVSQILYFVEVTEIVSMFEVPILNMELTHIIMFVVLTMFGLGVLRVEKTE